MQQSDLFGPRLPPGLLYRPDFLSADEERELITTIQRLPLREAQYRQYMARRRTLSP
jgi:hypothetical protein